MKQKLMAIPTSGAMTVLSAVGREGQWDFSLNRRWQFATNADVATWDNNSVPGNGDTLPVTTNSDVPREGKVRMNGKTKVVKSEKLRLGK